MAPSIPTRGVTVTARQLRRQFGGTSVLRHLDLHVPAGQFLTVLGRSGSGKSTLLRLLAGLDRPDGGRITGAGAADTRIMFQEPRLLPWASVLDNVTIGLGPAPGPEGVERARAALDQVGLGDRATDWPAVLSGGQKQRAALARALVSRPRLLVLDEPLGALDALTRIEMQALVERAWLEGGFTAILVTHDVSEAVVLGDRVVLLEDGVIGLDLPVDLARPRRRGSPELARLERRLLDRLLVSRGDPAEAA